MGEISDGLREWADQEPDITGYGRELLNNAADLIDRLETRPRPGKIKRVKAENERLRGIITKANDVLASGTVDEAGEPSYYNGNIAELYTALDMSVCTKPETP